jgi:hypothetical protein
MNFFAAQQQYITALFVAEIAFDAAKPQVMFGENEEIQPDQQGSVGYLRMTGGSVGIRRVDVEIANVFEGGHRR